MNIGGKKISNWWVAGGAGGLVVAFLIYRHYSGSSAASSSSASSSSIDPVTGLPYSQDNQVDPATGLTYLQEAQEYGSVQAAEEMVTSGSAYYGVNGSGPVDSGYPTYYPPSSPSPTGPGQYATNAAWAQAVTSGLAALGYDSQTVSAALGAFFAQMPLTSAQAGIIQAAEAEFGPPPQGTYSIIPEPPSPPPSTVAVPAVTGQTAGAAHNAIVAAGLVPRDPEGAVKGEATWKVIGSDPAAGTQVAKGSDVTIFAQHP